MKFSSKGEQSFLQSASLLGVSFRENVQDEAEAEKATMSNGYQQQEMQKLRRYLNRS
ncbi:hypothetical protein [Priestia koreensis]|uniref:hypothetical protein n=1 Tax=Priestia koreensis TaxID=284581 RepID=UPI000AE27827|nr:hypothetical protein [Priestia koreensis]MCM3002606.1 hypothetical protein [Priestia koreensis]UNL84312.1 hypothetical protein IE339_19550 [Priestia koreensis]